jgi:hypothetical protein
MLWRSTASYISNTDCRTRTIIVNTPRTVPTGICTQLIPATTSENVRCLRWRRKIPDMTFKTPEIKNQVPKMAKIQINIAKNSAGGRSLFLVLPKVRIGKHKMHHFVISHHQQDAERRQARHHKMKNRKQIQMVGVNVSLVPGQGRQWRCVIHKKINAALL